MGFAADLKDKFQYLARCGEDKGFYEIELVTKLQDSLLEMSELYPMYCHSEIIHGTRSGVEFAEKSHWVTGSGPICKKELADILFVIYSRSRRMFRICFMQNKRSDGGVAERFSADLLQLDLLHNRSVFTVETEGTKRQNTVLRLSRESSVALYGVFYKVGDTYEMDVYAAPGLRPKSGLGRSKERIVVFERAAAMATSSSSFRDEVCINGLENFASALVDCNVGRVIKMDDSDSLDVLRGIAGLGVCPKEVRNEIDRSVEKLEGLVEHHNKYADLNISNQIFFIDADEIRKK